MYRGTTPTLVFNLSKAKSLDLSNAQQIWVTLKLSPYMKTWDISQCTIDAEKKTITVTLTQEETLELPLSMVKAQIRILMNNGSALATNIVTINTKDILKGGVIE